MEQVFINLFLNALQAMSQGGVLTVATRHGRFGEDLKLGGLAFAHFQPGDPVVIVEVRDTGKGIPEDLLPKLFDPFLRPRPSGSAPGWASRSLRTSSTCMAGQLTSGTRPPAESW